MRLECPACHKRFDVPHGRVLEEADKLDKGRAGRLEKKASKDKTAIKVCRPGKIRVVIESDAGTPLPPVTREQAAAILQAIDAVLGGGKDDKAT